MRLRKEFGYDCSYCQAGHKQVLQCTNTLRFDLETDVTVVGGIIVGRHDWQFCPAYCNSNRLKCSKIKG